ncbi:ABC transporter ATP-binding protein [Fervidobacterium thailandense]|uniref:Oligopeptide ABC transporter ATP-binding protein n=1 Tax=Fervidobacterium thailandense TaxID=1008305 RepID=A0A1E3G486_9BACT|nr:ABC transporter ATP-binding protein [Fervidobacterium thailandense]ODN31054.1 oligopeptide ABC transporter ATP-binding protein [Fervidobacterium thailandense]
MLEVVNLSKVYNIGPLGREKFYAVDNVSFHVADGEIVSLIGESGSGKTTIGKMILRLIKPTSGKILFNSVDVQSIKNKKEYYRLVQGVFQDPFSSYNPIFKIDRVFDMVREEFFPEFTRGEWRKRVERVIEDICLNPSEILGKFPHQLSGGQLQRLLIARALLIDAKFLVADEIISMLDASTRIDVLNTLIKLKEKGLSVLFITHDLSLGYYTSDRTIILYRGSIMEYGDTVKIFKNPLHPYTKMLLESVPTTRKVWSKGYISLHGRTVPPTFCKFYDRCPLGDSMCKNVGLERFEEGHFVACVKVRREGELVA